jgi:predicted RNA-binding protein with PIN domain
MIWAGPAEGRFGRAGVGSGLDSGQAMADRLIVDGYNVIYAWDDLRGLLRESLELARDALVERLAVLVQLSGTDVTVVFDAHRTVGSLGSQEMVGGVKVVFTRSGLSADHVIERLAYLARREGRLLVVVTNDRFHGDMLRGMGTAVVDAAELRRQVGEAEAELARQVRRRQWP